MGCSISCALFENFVTFLQWALQKKSGLNTIDHYRDDFIFLGRPGTDECSLLVKEYDNLWASLGVPLAVKKKNDQ
jgi:hypothetical protein